MDNKKFCCEYCYSPIGYVDMDKLAEPMTPDMFSSIEPKRGIPDPFHPSLTWMDFKCPYCRLRPFLTEGWISLIDDKNNRTRIQISKIKAVQEKKGKTITEFQNHFISKKPKHQCSCGKSYKHQSSLTRHKAKCNG